MRIGLHDAEKEHIKHKIFPNLALMKLSAYHKETIAMIKEAEQYRAIGTLDEFHKAKEKRTPMQPDVEGDGEADGFPVYDTWICPSCGEAYEISYDDHDFCPKCGQKINRDILISMES